MLNHLTLIMIISTIFVWPLSTSASSLNNLTPNQKDFLHAYEAIKANDRPLIAMYKIKLKNYVLRPYLNYLDIKSHFDSTPKSQVNWFFTTYPKNRLTPYLKKKYLIYLAETKQYKTFLTYYQRSKHNSTQLTCAAIYATLSTTHNKTTLAQYTQQAKSLWSKQSRIKGFCQNIDTYLKSKHLLSGSMIWARVIKNMHKGKLKLAKAIAKNLSKPEQKMLSFWIKTYRQPLLAINHKMPSYINPVIRKEIFQQSVKRLSYSDPQKALKVLENQYQQYGLSQTKKAHLTQKISLRFAYQYHPDAQRYLAELDASSQNEQVINWRLQVALRQLDWLQFLDLYQRLPSSEQQSKRWLYWKARSIEALGQKKSAQKIYKTLAKERNFYGFLSADKLALPYQFNPKSSAQYSSQKLVKKYPPLMVMKELIAIDWKINLKREWYQLLKQANPNDIEAIALFMASKHQHNLAIQTIAKAKIWDDLDLRFPTPYQSTVKAAAKNNTIDPAWVYGVIRRESAFSSNISSHAGAVGLMQLMPATAKFIGRKIGYQKQQYANLIQPDSNINLGSAYLSYLAKRYHGNRVLATAAYNAGPNKVDSWIPKGTSLPADLWIDTIPYSETRAYVKAVLEYTTIFKSVLNNRYDRLENFMGVIGQLKTRPK